MLGILGQGSLGEVARPGAPCGAAKIRNIATLRKGKNSGRTVQAGRVSSKGEETISQIAEAFVAPTGAMERAAECCARGDRRGMRAALAPYRFEPFTRSGYVIVVVVEWLRDHSIELPRNGMPTLGRFLQISDPLLCAQSAEVEALADRLGSLTPSSDELSRYWVEFTGEDTPEADQFMTDAWGWLTRLVRAGTQSDWCVLLEG